MKKEQRIHVGLIVPLDGLPLIVGRVYDQRVVRRALSEAVRSAKRRADQQNDILRRLLDRNEPAAPKQS
jgi:hypothetical protein